ncbi:hypothetical protein I3843_13G106400 [Carya illinoinensis]|nr:hypothetical protein I3843_13G106400 [Carya illinoinensis]
MMMRLRSNSRLIVCMNDSLAKWWIKMECK